MQEKENILKILVETKTAIKNEDIVELKHLSNRTIHTASISQDPDNIAIAVIVYSLSKLIQRKHYHKYSGWNRFYREYINGIDKAILAIKKKDERALKNSLEQIRKAIDKLSPDFKKNIQDVFRKASINKASRIYEHGISMEKTSKLLGITLWELANYSGQTSISDAPLTRTQNVRQRIKSAMEIFE